MTDFVTTFSDGNELTAAEMNLIRSNRTGAMNPINNTSSNWEDNTQDLGASTYRYKDGYFGGHLIIGGSALGRDVVGDGSDGAYTSSDNFTLGGLKQYTSFNLQAGHTLTIDTSTKWLKLLVSGTLTIAGNISGVGSGGAAGTSGGAGGTGGSGGAGIQLAGTGGGGGSGSNFLGGAGGAISAALYGTLAGGTYGTVSGNGGAGNSASAAFARAYYDLGLPSYGSGGGGGTNGAGNTGGGGGGGLIIVCRNRVITGTPTISCAGANGSSGGGAGQGAGGGGGGGFILIKYGTLTGAIPTLTVTGGTGAVGADGDGGNGGAGISASIQI